MDKISIEQGLRIFNYELVESDYVLIMEAASVCIAEDCDSSLIDLLSYEKKKSVGFIICLNPMDAETVALIINSFFKIKKMAAFV